MSRHFQCILCDVRWNLTELDNHGDDKAIFYQGQLLELVDFTNPDTLSSPA